MSILERSNANETNNLLNGSPCCRRAGVTVRPAQARDTKYLLPIEAALAVKDAEEKLDGSVKFFFGNQETPKILTKLSTDMTNQKTNAVGKSDEKACNWVFLSAMIQLGKTRQTVGRQCSCKYSQLLSEKCHVEPDRVRMSRGGDNGRRRFEGRICQDR